MKIAIFGSGYVGLVTGICLADSGHNVICVDTDKDKINTLKKGELPIYEPGLKEMLAENQKHESITFTTNAKDAVEASEVIFIAVGTPPDEDGSADMKYVLAVAKTIGESANGYKLVVNKSTVPVGTADRVKIALKKGTEKQGNSFEFDVASNPEFLKEGDAIKDFQHPDRIVIGVENDKAKNTMRNLYSSFTRKNDRIIFMDIKSAELTKYAANSMLATKISFMNEMSNIADSLGADIEKVRNGIGSDSRIGFSFIYPGAGYGGSCFPKDVQALIKTAKGAGVNTSLLNATEQVNEKQKNVLFSKIKQHFGEDISSKTFAVWGLSFKPNTDDMRQATSLVLLEQLLNAGAKVQAYDPEALHECKRIFGEREGLSLVKKSNDALKNADCLVIVTEWNEFRNPDFESIKSHTNTIIDGRNMYSLDVMKELGFNYYSIGRKAIIANN